jgi:ABC-type transporter Mla subunit MlaD
VPDPDPATATVIPFPLRRRAPTNIDGQERLRRALEDLDDALAGQRAAIVAWRSALGELGDVVSGLGANLRRYRGSLDTLATRVEGLHRQAVQLERTADAALAVSPASLR